MPYIAMFLILVVTGPACAHGGGLDGERCHVEASTGIKHCHRGDPVRSFHGQVVSVTDGDTVKLSTGSKVRLSSIDCPESQQPHGLAARKALQDLVLGESVEVLVMTKDRYGRIIGRLHVGNTNINRALVRSGRCWHYLKYSRDPDMTALEAEARKARRGLWRDPSPTPPWIWRKARR